MLAQAVHCWHVARRSRAAYLEDLATLAGGSISSSARIRRNSGSTSISSAVRSGCRDLADEGGCCTDSSCALRCNAGE